METKTISIQKLNGSNFFMWKFKVELVLQRDKLWATINQEIPTTSVDEWTTRDQAAKATICLAIEDDLLINIRHCITAKETWNTLIKLYEHPSLSTKLHLLRRLYSTRYENYNNMKSFINAILELTGQLRNLGEVTNDKNIIAVMLCGLPPEYNNLITAIEAKEEDQLSLEYVKQKLYDEASRREKDNIANDFQSLAMSSTRRFPERLKNIICYGCGKPGHTKRECYREGPRRDAGRWTPSEVRKPNDYPLQTESHHGDVNMLVSTTERNLQPNLAADARIDGIQTIGQCQCNNSSFEEYTALSGTLGTNPSTWILDSGASAHMSPNKNFFQDINYLQSKIPITIANGETVYAEGRGSGLITLDNEIKKDDVVRIHDVLYVPQLKFQLLSIKQLCKKGHSVQFRVDKCIVKNKDKIIAVAILEGGTFNLKENISQDRHISNPCIHQWHNRMGHRSNNNIKRMVNQNMTKDLQINSCNHHDFCKACQIGKMKQRSFYESNNTPSKPFKTIVTDLCGPVQESSLGGNNYILTMTDIYSRYLHIEIIKTKSQATEKLIELINMGHNKFGYYPSILRSDGGGEFNNSVFDNYLTEHGIIHQTIVAYVPQQNGLAERVNYSLLSMIRCLLKKSRLPLKLWGEAADTAAYIINRTSHSAITCTPYELWHGVKPDTKNMKTFGCKAYAFVPKILRRKLDNTSKEGFFVGYGRNTKGYRLWVPGTNNVITTSKMTFEEDKFIEQEDSTNPVSENNKHDDTSIIFPTMNHEDDSNSHTDCLRRSSRSNRGIPPVKLTF